MKIFSRKSNEIITTPAAVTRGRGRTRPACPPDSAGVPGLRRLGLDSSQGVRYPTSDVYPEPLAGWVS
jgi:hypothetical protein